MEGMGDWDERGEAVVTGGWKNNYENGPFQRRSERAEGILPG